MASCSKCSGTCLRTLEIAVGTERQKQDVKMVVVIVVVFFFFFESSLAAFAVFVRFSFSLFFPQSFFLTFLKKFFSST